MTETTRPPRFVLVTGTDTEVGKTITTAALTVWHRAAGHRVAVVKPTQTGIQTDEPGDVDVIRRLADIRQAYELVRLPEPLAPESAGLRSGTELPPVAELAERTVAAASTADADMVLVEGAGGVAVRLDRGGGTLLDIGRVLQAHGDVEVIVVVRAGLGTLNHTVLTVDRVRAAGLDVGGLVIGSWPIEPDLAAATNREDLPRITQVPLLAAIPAGAGDLTPEEFRRQAPTWYEMRG